jgi:thiamine pyrophosphokinase
MIGKRAVIIASGSFGMGGAVKDCLAGADTVICADGGADHALRLGIMPQIILGDFDSISNNAKDSLAGQQVKAVKFPREKDKTDTQLAVEFAASQGAGEIFLLGATGSRLDHTLANLYLLTRAEELGVKLSLVDQVNQVWLVSQRIALEGSKGQFVSLLPLTSQVEGVTTRGLKYPLTAATLKWGSSWGVSNEFLVGKAEVSIKEGLLLVIKVWEEEA